MIWPRQSYPDLGLYYGIIISRVKKIIVSIHSIRPHLGITISVCKLEPLQKKATKMVKEFQKHVIWETAKEMGVLNWETRRLENIKSWLYSIWRMAGKTRIRFLSRPKGKHWWFSLQKRKSSSCRSTLAYYTWRSVSHVWLCEPMDCNPPGSSVHRILQARNTGVGSHSPLLRIFLTEGLGDQTQISRIAGRFFTVWATQGSPYM